jgi:hypothetical protein
MSNRFSCAILWAMILSEAVSCGWAQLGTQGAIVGLVTDSSDAALAGAAVTVQNIETGLKLSAVTNDSGIYEVLALPVGYYSVTISYRGFRPWTLERTQLTVGERKRLEPKLEVGEIAERVCTWRPAPNWSRRSGARWTPSSNRGRSADTRRSLCPERGVRSGIHGAGEWKPERRYGISN